MTEVATADNRISQAELFEIFGERVPMDAVEILWRDGMTPDTARTELRRLAAARPRVTANCKTCGGDGADRNSLNDPGPCATCGGGGIEPAPDQSERVRELEAEVARLHERLEDNHYFNTSGERIEAEPGAIPDGIACRDETIKTLDEKIARYESALAEARKVIEPFAKMRVALDIIQAGKPGADKLRDDRAILQTWGLKDTPTSAQLTLGDLREARDWHNRNSPSDTGVA